MFKLRDYQQETIDNITKSIHAGHKSIMVQQPPRTGKTVIMAEIARRATAKGNRILFVVHRQEIVQQVIKTFKANDVNMNLAKIGMVQTITRHVHNLDPPQIIFVDEAHHVLAKSYQRILGAFPNAYKLLFTATPYRLGGQGFTDVADDLIIGKPVSWLIDHHFLAPVDYYAPSYIDTAKLKVKRTGEFDESSIKEAMKPKIYGNAVKHYMKLAKGMQAIAYTYNVESAQRLANSFNGYGISAKAVSGKTPKDERKKIIEDYRQGKIQIVTNAELFTEGLDLPNVDCVIMLRPTQSLSLYLQFAMRSMNPRKDKTAVIIDHVGNVQRFGLPTDDRQWSLEGKGKDKQQSESTIKPVSVCPTCFASFYRTNDICPYCGSPLGEEKEIEVVDNVQLKKVTKSRLAIVKQIQSSAIMKNVAGKRPNELKNLKEIQAYAKLKGYKPGWAYHYAKRRGFIKK
ncbi:DEAD/DEAH box helicase [Limosilactobacillus sp. RRLNB_1_1]|uniref:DEAD/DEAH box helicase n=1 Tax=Limosilactobacillus albertensis TaxID=2759752 RepID=A0A7W3TQP9_9LACO|nr:DEAD/DEAH box helicase [Limosilactobacillus albertensis]MBB1069140.1 DEAD/DEAH box helicase [Limosilactobacillus albertensis]MCD7117453.1 DEAD/DEAH box helicase [Limosilactobacillus albertensis]MCD7127925.1 DEAD/DEAH box helicase [Limosilactobacillus albertensis]